MWDLELTVDSQWRRHEHDADTLYYSLNRYQWGLECLVRVSLFFVHIAHLPWELWSQTQQNSKRQANCAHPKTIGSSTTRAGILRCTVPCFLLIFFLLPHPPQQHFSQVEWMFQKHFTAASLTNSLLLCVPPPLPLPSMWHVCDLSL